jgi:putative nucleotidyltransferase with HDIG domain
MRRLGNARRGNGERKRDNPARHTWLRAAVGVGVWAAACLILLGYNLFPGRMSLEVGEPSPALIRAPRTAQYVDREATERLRQEAEQSVSPQYSRLPHARADAEKHVDTAFASLEDAQKAGKADEPLRRSLPGVTDASVEWVLEASPGEIRVLRDKARDVLREVMSKEIRAGTGDLKAAQEEAAAAAKRRESRPEAAALLAEIVRREVAPNRRLDEDATWAARTEARERVQEVVRTIEANHAIVFEGERVTREHLGMLHALGLSSPRLDYRRMTSTALLVGLIVVLLGVQTRHWAPPVYEDPKRLLLLSLLVVVPLFVINLLTLALPNVWMLIVPAATLMAAVLLADVIGMSLALVLSLLVGLMSNGGLGAALLSLGSAAAALAYASHIWPIARLRWIVGSMAVTNLVLVAAIGLLQTQSPLGIAREAGLAALLYSPGAAVLGLGGILLLQRPFGITTPLGLLELSNPQVPLLRRLQSEAPGTYHHSLMVASLAEAAAEAVGADAMLARTGGLYHDIGKLGRPAFFVENQALLGLENAHDRLSSSLSALIIISHVKDGLDLGREHRLPPELLEIISQHHGTTLVSYFYRQALGGDHPEAVSEEQYRYLGPLPESKEAVLVMLADAVQAAAKSIPEPTPQRVEQMVRELVRDRVVDGQLQGCDLTFRDIAVVEATMARVLAAVVCRNRIEYPEPIAAG